MGEPPLSNYEVVKFLMSRGGRCTNYELVSNFREILNHPLHQAEARLKFKDIINKVAIIEEFQNVKYIELKEEYGSQNNYKEKNEDPHFPNHSSLPSEGVHAYSSPVCQSFQPYWRYRLSISPQVPPVKQSDSEMALHSSKSISRSVSESTLPQDRPPPLKPRTIRYSSENQQKLNKSYNPLEQTEKVEEFSRPNSNILPQNLLRDEEIYRYSLGHHSSVKLASSPPNSLPYCNFNSNRSITKSTNAEGFQEENIGLSHQERCFYPTKTDRRRSASNIELNPQRRCVPETRLKEMAQNRQHFGNQSEHTRNLNHRNMYEQQEQFSLDANRNDKSCIPKMKSTSSKSQGSSPRTVETSASNVNRDYRHLNETASETDEENIFADPNYLRTVSKLCLEKNKARRVSAEHLKCDTNSPELQLRDKTGAKSSNNQLNNELIDKQNESDKEHKYIIPATDKDIRIVGTEAPIPPERPERRRRLQEKEQKVANKIKDDAKPTEEATNVVPTKVKDRVQHFDEMEKKQRKGVTSGDKENRASIKSVGTDDDVSISVLDPKLKREWFVKASQCDYHALISLLKKEPKLAAIKDISSGYTALHWAAKHGDANVVKLIAGAYKVNPNHRSNGGYTPVHLASLYKHDMIGHLLIHTYGADPSLRDYSGKRADQYPHNYVRRVAGHKNVERRPLKQRPLVAKETTNSSFIRIGSLNLKKARKSTVFASVRGSNRNRNSISDLRPGNQSSVRKKLLKRENSVLDKKYVLEKREESDSDSAYGFPSKKQDS